MQVKYGTISSNKHHGVLKAMVENFGFIHERIEIKVLVLFIMRRLPEPVTIEVLTELVMCDEGVSYFDVTDCIAMLVKTKHLKLENKLYSLTTKGRRNGEILEKNLPYSVRTKAEDVTAVVRGAQSRNAMIKTNRTATDEGGYKVSLSLSDGIGDIISMDLFAANEQQANTLENGFRKNAEKVYNMIIEMLTNKERR